MVLEISEYLQDEGVGLIVTEQQGINMTTPEGKLFFTILSAVAEFEHGIMTARTMDGLAAARARGRQGGRKGKLTPPQIKEVRKQYAAGGKTVQQIADLFDVTRPTIYRCLND